MIRPGLRVDVAVEDHRADLPGEEVGVGGSEERAVRDAEVGQLRLAHRPAELVEVAGGVGGRHMAQQLGVPPLTASAQIRERGDPGRPLLFAHRETDRLARIPCDGFLGAREAVHRGAVADSAWIPADDVEPFPYLAWEGLVVLGHLHRSGASRAAGAEEQSARATSGAGRLSSDDGQLDGATTGVEIVQRYLGDRAVELRSLDAGFPVQPRGGYRGERHVGRSGIRRGEGRGTEHRRRDDHGPTPTVRYGTGYGHAVSLSTEVASTVHPVDSTVTGGASTAGPMD